MKTTIAAFTLALAALPALAQNVKITPVGSHPGELCANDRAMTFEDPTGVRILYDTAHNLTGGDDPRLGAIHLVLLPHMHGDHVGDLKLKAPAGFLRWARHDRGTQPGIGGQHAVKADQMQARTRHQRGQPGAA